MNEERIAKEMAEIASVIRFIKQKKPLHQNDFNDIRSMEARHRDLAAQLQKIQREEIGAKNERT